MDVLIPNQDTQLFTTVHQNTGKDTIILLHGGPGVPDGLTYITKYLSQNFQVINFHQRGTLKSPCRSNNYALEAYISDITCIADYFGIEKFHLFGHSWGGLYAQLYAYKNPERLLSLFLCSPAPGTGYQWKNAMLEVARYNKNKCSLPEWLALISNSFFGLLGSDQAYRKFYRQALINFSRGFREDHPEYFRISYIKARCINRITKNILLHPILPPFTNPAFKTTITFGDQDIFGESKKYVVQRFPTASVHLVPESGHIPWSHNQRVFVPILKEHFSI